MMKIMTVLGTRPEIIRLSRVIEKLDLVSEHILIHTGQNYDPNLNEIFFQELSVRPPDYFLEAKGSFGAQVGSILKNIEEVILKEKPDKILILGDTNSALSGIVAKRLAVPVYHMEAGNRCFDDRVPEEVNRRLIDHASDILMPYTERSRQNLIREGISGQNIYVTGNPIFEVINHYSTQISRSDILNKLSLEPKNYFLVTLHRAENVDFENRLIQFTSALEKLQSSFQLPIIVSTHPRTRNKMNTYGINVTNPLIHFVEPFGFIDFIKLEKHAYCVLSDSGTVQEECSIFNVPNVTLRDVTERPETIECGSNILSGSNPDSILKCVEVVLLQAPNWSPPIEYLEKNVSQKIVRILLSYKYP